MNLSPEEFRKYRIRVFNGGQVVETYEGQFYIYNGKGAENPYTLHFMSQDLKHHKIFGDVIVDEI